ncbi:hypothetical protein BKA56DRAFT_588187 [Ilyonectria sp. MPI-CAGE-AT-0026]|nr:hypothetical protein BKA56DRAFT_588187 [Ilyonectria sp. MPI-CAGE-AT-0026]
MKTQAKMRFPFCRFMQQHSLWQTSTIRKIKSPVSKEILGYPVMGYCSDCGRAKRVPVEPLQCRCKQYGKGGASIKMPR